MAESTTADCGGVVVAVVGDGIDVGVTAPGCVVGVAGPLPVVVVGPDGFVVVAVGWDVVVARGLVVVGLPAGGRRLVVVTPGAAVVVLLLAAGPVALVGNSGGTASPPPRLAAETSTAGLSPPLAQPARPRAVTVSATTKRFRFTPQRSGSPPGAPAVSRLPSTDWRTICPSVRRGSLRPLTSWAMASFGVRGSDAVVDVAVFRGLVDLMLDFPGLSQQATGLLTDEREVGGLTLDRVKPALRDELEAALAFATNAARRGERSPRSGDDVAPPDRLVVGGEIVGALFADG
jgi:hypothetical protein